MHLPNYELSAAERMVPAIDTKYPARATELMQASKSAGAWVVKEGLELMMATSPRTCSELAEESGVEWIADFKLKDISNTVAGAVESIVALDHPPIGITVHTKSGIKALKEAQRVADERDITIFGVTHLTSIDEGETKQYEKATPKVVVWRESRRAVAGGIGGLVCSAQEIGMIKRFKKTNGLYTMIPGTRSLGANLNDQKRPQTPFEAIVQGADLLVIGRQVTAADNFAEEFGFIESEIQMGLNVVYGNKEAA
jgi:orotidine-5'-phosphate decarboxylase